MSNEIITKIVELKQKIEQIPDSENFDDLKELEYFDLEIVNIISLPSESLIFKSA